jgi:hypothetical protein
VADKSRKILCILRIGRTDSESAIALPKKQFKKGRLVAPPKRRSPCPPFSPSEMTLAELLTKGKPLPSKEKGKQKRLIPPKVVVLNK